MAAYSPTGSGDIHYDQILTNVSLAWPNNSLIGDALFPVIKVKKQSDKYYVFGREAWLIETSDYRAAGTEANEILGFTVSKDSYYAQEHALQIPITDEERDNADSVFSPEADGTELLTSKIMLSRELAIKNLVTTVANYATGMSVTLTGTAQWNDYVNSNPISDFKIGDRAVHAKIFMEPNVAVIPYLVMETLEDHPDIIERIKYSERAILTPEIIAAVFGIEQILVPGVAIGAGVASAGLAITGSYLWGKDVVLAYVAPRPGVKQATLGYEFNWTQNGNVQVVDRWRENKRKSDLIRVSRRYDLKLVGIEENTASGDFGKIITGYLIKNAIA